MADRRKRTKKKKSSTVRFVGIILAVFIVMVAVNVAVQLNTYVKLKAQKDEIEEQIGEEEKKKEDYNNQMEYYSTDEYIEKIAREQLGLVMPDEIVFKVSKD